MAKLRDWLLAGETPFLKFEAQFPNAPKLTTALTQVATSIPAGIDLPAPPAMMMKAPELPALPDLFKGPTTAKARLDVSTYSPSPAGGKTPDIISRRGV